MSQGDQIPCLLNRKGITFSWTGIGATNPISVIALKILLSMPNSLNVFAFVLMMLPHLFHQFLGLLAGRVPAEIMEIDVILYT